MRVIANEFLIWKYRECTLAMFKIEVDTRGGRKLRATKLLDSLQQRELDDHRW